MRKLMPLTTTVGLLHRSIFTHHRIPIDGEEDNEMIVDTTFDPFLPIITGMEDTDPSTAENFEMESALCSNFRIDSAAGAATIAYAGPDISIFGTDIEAHIATRVTASWTALPLALALSITGMRSCTNHKILYLNNQVFAPATLSYLTNPPLTLSSAIPLLIIPQQLVPLTLLVLSLTSL